MLATATVLQFQYYTAVCIQTLYVKPTFKYATKGHVSVTQFWRRGKVLRKTVTLHGAVNLRSGAAQVV
jgi:hypothetical protein